MMKNNMNNAVMDELNEALTCEDVNLDARDTHSSASKKTEKKLNINNSILLDIISDLSKAKFVWKCTAVLLAACLLGSAFMYFNLYKDNQILNDKAANTAKLETKLAESKAQAQSESEKLKAEILKAYSELTAVRRQLDESRNETAQMKAKLDEATEQFNSLQKRNAEVAKILNERLQKLSNQPDGTSKK